MQNHILKLSAHSSTRLTISSVPLVERDPPWKKLHCFVLNIRMMDKRLKPGALVAANLICCTAILAADILFLQALE